MGRSRQPQRKPSSRPTRGRVNKSQRRKPRRPRRVPAQLVPFEKWGLVRDPAEDATPVVDVESFAATLGAKIDEAELREASGGPMSYSTISLSAVQKPALAGPIEASFKAVDFGWSGPARPMKILSLKAAVVSDVCPVIWWMRNSLTGKTTSKIMQVNGTSPHFANIRASGSEDYVNISGTTELGSIKIGDPMITTGGIQILVEVVASVGFTF